MYKILNFLPPLQLPVNNWKSIRYGDFFLAHAPKIMADFCVFYIGWDQKKNTYAEL